MFERSVVLRIGCSVVWWLFLICGLVGPALASSAGYEFETLDLPDSANTFLYDVNNRGEAVGQGYDANYAFSTAAVLGRQQAFTYIVPRAFDTSFNSISHFGLVAGSYTNRAGITVAFTFGHGRRSPDFAATSDAIYTTAGLNDAGDLAGIFTTDFIAIHAFARIDGVVRPFDYPSSTVTLTEAFKLNRSSTVVGWYADATGSHGYTRERGGRWTRIDVPGAYLTRAFGINHPGDVVGYFQLAQGGVAAGFVWRDGSFESISFPGAASTLPQGINDHGQVVGFYQAADGTYHGFLASPVER